MRVSTVASHRKRIARLRRCIEEDNDTFLTHDLFVSPTQPAALPELKESVLYIGNVARQSMTHIGICPIFSSACAMLFRSVNIQMRYATRAYTIPINHIWRDETIEIEVRASRIFNNKA